MDIHRARHASYIAVPGATTSISSVDPCEGPLRGTSGVQAADTRGRVGLLLCGREAHARGLCGQGFWGLRSHPPRCCSCLRARRIDDSRRLREDKSDMDATKKNSSEILGWVGAIERSAHLLKIAAASDARKPNGDDQLRQALPGVAGSVSVSWGACPAALARAAGAFPLVQCSDRAAEV